MAELAESKVKAFNLTLCDGTAVIRNQKRINGLIGVRLKDIPEQYHGLLAKADFVGNVVDETIIWSTDVFKSDPVRLPELPEQDKERYREILRNALVTYANAISTADKNVKKLLYAAITYPTENAVFCADDKVVIIEWGMTPLGEPGIIGLPYSIDDTVSSPQCNKPGQSLADSDIEDNRPLTDDDRDSNAHDGDNLETVREDKAKSGSDNNSDNNLNDNKESLQDFSNEQQTGVRSGDETIIVPPTPPEPPISPSSPRAKKPWWKRNWWVWLLLLLLLLLLLIMLRNCDRVAPVAPITPEIGKEDIVLSEDSLRYVASNRILLLLTDDNADIDKFAKDFKQKYPDKEKYLLSNPDTLINRVTLTLPADERTELSERLPDEFAGYGLVVIPETMYKCNDVTNDPALKEKDKRWYFDECAVFDAWNVTKGSEDIVVAVIDDGFDLTHPELAGKVVNPYNAVTHDSNIFPSASGHGTHVAATAIGNANNAVGSAGIAPDCKLMPIQVGDKYGNMSSSAIFDAVVYAIQNGADVVNMSLGMSFGPFIQFVPPYIQKNLRANMFLEEQRIWDYLFSVAKQHNVTFVLAAGNENAIVGLDPMQRSENSIKVSATQPDRYKASFSNYGDMSTVSAPGVRIFNAVPGNSYTFMDGTSMASPIVAGGCALLKSNDPSLTVTDLARILRETGTPSGSDVGPIVNFARALDTGYCVPNDDCAAINERYNELLAELERLKREHPGCIQTPDTLSLPKNFTSNDLIGRWKSTTSLFNEMNEQVVIYFTFDGSPKGKLEIVEPSGAVYTATLNVAIENDVVNINQQETASNSNGKGYNPYLFVLRPDHDRKAAGRAKNKVETANIFEFNLTRI